MQAFTHAGVVYVTRWRGGGREGTGGKSDLQGTSDEGRLMQEL